jgi:hypothetical protein
MDVFSLSWGYQRVFSLVIYISGFIVFRWLFIGVGFLTADPLEPLNTEVKLEFERDLVKF